MKRKILIYIHIITIIWVMGGMSGCQDLFKDQSGEETTIEEPPGVDPVQLIFNRVVKTDEEIRCDQPEFQDQVIYVIESDMLYYCNENKQNTEITNILGCNFYKDDKEIKCVNGDSESVSFSAEDKNSYCTAIRDETQNTVTLDCPENNEAIEIAMQGEKGDPGKDGISIFWQRGLAESPDNPKANWAYYNTTDKISYIFDGSQWQIMTQDGSVGAVGPQGPSGQNGTNGLTSLVSISDEAPGVNCTNGGQAFKNGIDDNSDGVLTTDEVDSTTYVCNGNDGADGTTVTWKGSLSEAPINPESNWAYYHTGQKITCIFNGSFWETMIATDQSGNCNPAPTNGLLLEMTFSGDATDSSGNANNGTVNSPILAPDRFGNANRAYQFDGVDDRIELTPVFSQDQDPVSFSVWIQLVWTTLPQEGKTIFGEYNGEDTRNYFGLTMRSTDDGGISFDQYKPTGGVASVNTDLRNYENSWIHLVIVKDNDKVFFYRNSVQIGAAVDHTESYSGAAPTIAAIGARNISGDWTGYTFQGIIDDVRIYNRALSNAEISSLFHENGYSGGL